jgi:putative chitinase
VKPTSPACTTSPALVRRSRSAWAIAAPPKYCGRGYVQLTWKANYRRASDECGVDLLSYPDKALDPAIAAKIMREGMTEGWFTGKGFSRYLPAFGRATSQQYAQARYIINGTDKAQQIAAHAKQFEDALVAGGWS